jgi:hypothetical protein
MPIVLLVFLLVASSGITAQGLYIPSPKGPFYGIRVNEKMNHPKTIHYPYGAFEDYKNVANNTPFRKGKSIFVRKSTDADGNVYYETNDRMSFGIVLRSLWKISDSGKRLEMVGRVAWIEAKDFPKEISPTDPQYVIYYRQDQ